MTKTVAGMFEDVIRVGFLVLIGLALTIAVVWYVGFTIQEIRGTGQVVIDPFTVVRDDGKGDDQLGQALAQMLQVRLQSLARELRDAQAALTTDVSASALTRKQVVATVGNVRLWTQAVSLQTGLLQPVDMKLSVAGVDVGGVIPWLQRRLTSRRTLHFTMYLQGDEAQVFGSVSALRLSNEELRLSIKDAGGKTPPLATIVDRLAHEILRRYLAQDTSNKFELLNSDEFFGLAEILVSTAQANRRVILGRPEQSEFARLVPQITALADQVPNWAELGYLAARIADSGQKSEIALIYYERALPTFEGAKNVELVKAIKDRIAALTPETEVASGVRRKEALPPSVDYSSKIKSIRDSGAEGSVVGEALATALEFQIEKALSQTHRISARYIYYAAREAGGLDLKTDSGAQIRDAVKVLATKGAVEESVWPYKSGEFAEAPPPAVESAMRFRITATRPLNNLNDVKWALIENGPVVAGISVFQEMMTASTSKTGVIPLPAKSATIMGGHAIVIVGYNDAEKRVKFANSWGRNWGDHGYGYLPYEYVEKYMSDAWTFKLAPQ
jgi:Papain family cysteine protease